MHRRGRVLPVVLQRRLDLLLGGEDHRGGLRNQVQWGAELGDREHLGQIRGDPFLESLGHRQLGQLPVLYVELGRGSEFDFGGVTERALGEGREPAHRLDLVAEELDPGRPVLGRGEDVEDSAAHGELPALGHLVDPLVTGGRKIGGDHRRIDLLPDRDREAGRAEPGAGNGLGQRDRRWRRPRAASPPGGRKSRERRSAGRSDAAAG